MIHTCFAFIHKIFIFLVESATCFGTHLNTWKTFYSIKPPSFSYCVFIFKSNNKAASFRCLRKIYPVYNKGVFMYLTILAFFTHPINRIDCRLLFFFAYYCFYYLSVYLIMKFFGRNLVFRNSNYDRGLPKSSFSDAFVEIM